MTRMISAAGALVVTLTSLAGPAAAQTVANGTYYAPPSWNLTLPVTTRFIVLANFNQEAVLDRETGLVWQRTPDDVLASWKDATLACMRQDIAGRSGWRLPSIHELGTLAAVGETLADGHPFDLSQHSPDATFWSSTDAPADEHEFGTSKLTMTRRFPGGNGGWNRIVNRSYWCVRGGNDAGQPSY